MTEKFFVSIHLFATLKDLVGTKYLSLEISIGSSVNDLRQHIIADYPQLVLALPKALAAVNHEYVYADHLIQPNDEIAFFPPVSGGSGLSWPQVFMLADKPIDLNELSARVVSPSTGAVALFSGYVRGETQDKANVVQTSYLEYEAYEPMALAKMQQVADEIRQQWPLVQGIAIVQRVGRLEVGQPTVLIACAAGHRDQGCFEAARYGIDRLKEIVPVWKKEVGPDNSYWVEGHYYPTPPSLDTSSD